MYNQHTSHLRAKYTVHFASYELAINFAYWTSLRARERKVHVKLQKILPGSIALA